MKLGNAGRINERCLELQKNKKDDVSKMKVVIMAAFVRPEVDTFYEIGINDFLNLVVIFSTAFGDACFGTNLHCFCFPHHFYLNDFKVLWWCKSYLENLIDNIDLMSTSDDPIAYGLNQFHKHYSFFHISCSPLAKCKARPQFIAFASFFIIFFLC